jgi:hypothetical protein
MAQKARELLARVTQQKEESQAIQAFWKDMLPEVDIPGGGQCRVWLKQYGFDTVVAGIEAMLVKFNRDSTPEEGQEFRVWDSHDAIRYASGCMRNIRDRGAA